MLHIDQGQRNEVKKALFSKACECFAVSSPSTQELVPLHVNATQNLSQVFGGFLSPPVLFSHVDLFVLWGGSSVWAGGC